MTDELKPWKVLRTRLLLDGSPWLRVMTDDLLLPDGRLVEGFYRIEAPDFVMIFPLTDDEHVLALRGYKHGPGRVIFQLPAGYMDQAGESPLDCARRELLEETGCVADGWHSLGSLSVNGNRGMGRAHLFLAQGVRAVAEPDSGDLEALAIRRLSLSRLRQLWRAGEFDNTAATALIGLALDELGGLAEMPVK